MISQNLLRFSLGLFFVLLGFAAACRAEPTSVSVSRTPLAAETPSLAPNSTQTVPTSNTPSVAPTKATTATPAAPHGTITVAGVGTPSTEITALPDFIANGVFDSLLKANPRDGSLEPSLATSWTVSQDAKTFTFTLRDGVKWHDGQALTADDVVFTLKTLSDPDIRITPAADFGPIGDVTATDAHTVSVTFQSPYCAALASIGNVKILPKHVLDGKPLDNVAPTDLIGTGPLVLKTWSDTEIALAANPMYWGGQPQIVNWTYKPFPDATAALAAVNQGKADVVVSDSPQQGLTYKSAPANEFFALAMNLGRKPFDDAKVRQAVALAIDRAALIQITGKDASALMTSVLPAAWFYPTNLADPTTNIEQAKDLMKQAGWTDTDGDGILDQAGKPLQVTLWLEDSDPRALLTAQGVRQQLAQIGIQAILKPDDRDLYLTRVFLHEYDLSLVHFNIPNDPDQHYFWSSDETKPGFGLNVTGYSNPQVDAALTAGNQVAQCEAGTRKSAYAPVFSQVGTDLPMVFLFAPPLGIQSDSHVTGIAPSSFAGPFWNLNTWEVSP